MEKLTVAFLLALFFSTSTADIVASGAVLSPALSEGGPSCGKFWGRKVLINVAYETYEVSGL